MNALKQKFTTDGDVAAQAKEMILFVSEGSEYRL